MTDWKDESHDLLDDLIRRLEESWRSGDEVDLAQLVPPADHPARQSALVALIQTDQELRWQHGQYKTVEEYLVEWPELRAAPECVAELNAADERLQAESASAGDPAVEADRGLPPQPRAIQILCPHCHCRVEIVDRAEAAQVTCPSCGSGFRLAGEATGSLPSEGKTAALSPPRRIAHFELLEILGEGAFGSVWKARDTRLSRIVAIKIPRRGQFQPDDVDRFLREAQAPAELHHPNIVAVFEVGQEDDLLYIVSEFIEGKSLDRWLAAQGRRLTDREAAKLCVTIAEALHYAHRRRVIHRDLKPSNIMIDAAGQPHLMDFGLAKRDAGEITMTVEGQILGTPAYMSPEQARGDGHLADARSDIYSLGVILFELLTGERPFRGDVAMLLRQVVEDEAPSARKLNSRISRDLETVCAKCLEKSPPRRYHTSADLADDLGHFLAGEPIHARPVGQGERLWRWCERQPVVAALTLAIGVSLLLGAVISSYFAITAGKQRKRADEKAAEATTIAILAEKKSDEAEKQRQTANTEKNIAEQNQYCAWIALAHQKWLSAEVGEAEKILDGCQTRFRHWEWRYLKRLCHLDLLTLRGHTSWVRGVCFSPDGKRLATASYDNTAKVWDAATGREVLTFRGHKGWVFSVCFSPDGKRLATASGDNTAKIWDAATGKELLALRGHTSWVRGVCFSPDGKRLATGCDDNTTKIWDAASGRELLTLRGHDRRVMSVCFSPNGKHLATASWDTTAKVWDAASGQELLTLRGHASALECVCFSLDGKRLATASWDNTAKIWDAASGQELLTLRGHTGGVDGVNFSPDGKRLATAGGDNTTKVWDPAGAQETLAVITDSGMSESVCFSPDGKRLATDSRNTAKIWDAATGKEMFTLRGHTSGLKSVCFSPDGKRLATASSDCTAKTWDAAGGRELLTLRGHTNRVDSVCFSPDGKRLATTSGDNTTRIWDAASGQELSTQNKGHTHHVCFSPDGHRLAAANDYNRTATIWDAANRQMLLTLRGHAKGVNSVCFSPDGTRLATASGDQTAKIWDAATGQELLTLRGHPSGLRSVCFSRDGNRLATLSGDGTVRVWEAWSVSIEGVASDSRGPSARRLVTVGEDATTGKKAVKSGD